MKTHIIIVNAETDNGVSTRAVVDRLAFLLEGVNDIAFERLHISTPDGLHSVSIERSPRALACDMEKSCKAPITHIDEKGFVYCQPHGRDRQGTMRCRKLTAKELKQLQRGEAIAY